MQALTSCDEHAHSNRSVQGSVQGGNGGNVTECSKCKLTPTNCAHTRHTVNFSGAMERYMRGFNSAQNSRSPATTHTTNSEHTIGAMEEMSRQGMKQGEHTSPASLEYTLVLVSVAVP